MSELKIQINPKKQIKLAHFYDYSVIKTEDLYKFYSAPKEIRKAYVKRVIAENPDVKPLIKSLDRKLKRTKAANAIATIATLPFAITAATICLVEVTVATLPLLGLSFGLGVLSEAESIPGKIASGALTGISGVLTFATMVPLDLAVGITNSPNALRQVITKKSITKKYLKEAPIMEAVRKMTPESSQYLDEMSELYNKKYIEFEEDNIEM